MASRVEDIWYRDPTQFVDLHNLLYFIPKPSTSFEEQLNAALRFSIYFGLIMTILRNDLRAIFFPIFVAILTVVLYEHETQKRMLQKQVYEKLDLGFDKRRGQQSTCVLPTKENPYMNVLLSDYQNFPNKPPACNIENRAVKSKIREYSSDVPRNIDDVYFERNDDRSFYTMPSTTIPNDQEGFGKWLYGDMPSVKQTSYDDNF